MFGSVLLLSLGFTVVTSHDNPFFRLDYTYVEAFGSFYKLHWDHDGASWDSAFLACDVEDATLFYPKVADERIVVKSLMTAMKKKPNVTDILVGIRDVIGFGEFMTVDGLPTPFSITRPAVEEPTCVTMNSDSGSFKTGNCAKANVPFVCKKHATIEICPTIDKAYVYNKEIGKCYKINERKNDWTNAMQTCFLEGGSLLLIKNSIEAEIIKNKLSANNTDYFVGFRRLFPDEYYTVKGEKFDDNFYKNWYNNAKDCGNIFKYNDILYTQTIDCLVKKAFICEMAPKIYTWSNLGNRLMEAELSYYER